VRGQSERLLLFFQNELQSHFKFEEVELFPRLLKWSTVGGAPWQPLLQTLCDDHRVMRAMIDKLSTGCDERVSDQLRSFGEQLRTHIQVEERELFERMQKECSDDQLAEVMQLVSAYAGTAGSSCSFLDD
tara:strand:+ start:1834 stop:2223 length:390 start_codon:yes stop_codon:yes gene_type:complete